MQKKISVISLLIAIVLIITISIGTSYSLWTTSVEQESVNSVDVGCFRITFNDRNIYGGGDISLSNAYPMTNTAGSSLTPYKFSISNQCSIASSYNVNLETLTTSTMDETKLDVYFNDSVIQAYTPNVSNGLSNDAKSAMNLARGYLPAGETVVYSLRVWIDYNVTTATPNVQGKTWNGRIAVNSEATFSKPAFGEKVTTAENVTLDIDTRSSKTVSTLTCYYGSKASQENLGTAIGTTKCQYPIAAEYAKYTVTYTDGTTDSSYAKKINDEIDYGDATAAIGASAYNTLQAAVDSVPTDGTKVNIKLLKNINEIVLSLPGQNIELDLNGHTMSNNNNNTYVLGNQGTMIVRNGYITSNSTQGAVNNENKVSGSNVIPDMKVIDVSVTATGTRQAIYNNGGTLEISGNTILSATSSERAALQNKGNGTITILSGQVSQSTIQAIENESGSTLILGSKDNVVDATTPVITGTTYAVHNAGVLKFYDGTLKGVSGAIDGTTYSDHEETGTETSGTEGNYHTLYFE